MAYEISYFVRQFASLNRTMSVFILTLFVSAITSCTVMETQVVTPTPSLLTPVSSAPILPQDWKSRWLKGIPCRAPCWEGITPGQTNASEAIEILSRSNLVTNVRRDPTLSFRPQLGSLSWDWKAEGNGGEAEYLNDSSQTISSIIPRFGVSFSLRDVMVAYGEPTHIIAIAQRRTPDRTDLCQEITIVYLPQGLWLGDNCYPKVSVNEDMKFMGIVFFVPTRAGLEAIDSRARDHPDWVLPWQGFKSFDFYCRDDRNGKYCRGEPQ